MTFCEEADCPITKCTRHQCNASKNVQYIRVTDFMGDKKHSESVGQEDQKQNGHGK